MQLNPMQMQAVEHQDGPLLIVAGAGSGKTRVLTHRIAHLLKKCGARPWEILAITFTNKAAGEMKERVEKLVGVHAHEMWVTTFHSACVRILRRDIHHLGYEKNFVIYDTSDQQTLIKECLKELNIDEKKFAPRAVGAQISDAKNRLVGPKEYERKAFDYFAEVCASVYKLYQDKLKRNNALDFDDLIMLTVQLLEKEEGVLDYYRNRFQYILVDEYQDTNHAQYRLTNLLAGGHRNLCVVGDPDQSIYMFRGADLTNILDFERDYPEAKVINLVQNYRSTKTILEAANYVVKNNEGRKEKDLWTENAEGQPIVHYLAQDEKDEAFYVVSRIQKIHSKENKPYNHFAILYRTNAQSRAVEEELMKSRIPYRIFGGLKFYDRKEIKDILAYLRVLLNPEDTVGLRRIINTPKRGIGDASVDKVQQYAASQGISLYQALYHLHLVPGLTARAINPMSSFLTLMEGFRKEMVQLKVTQLVDIILERTGYIHELQEERTIEARSRIENLQEFRTVTMDFDKKNPDLPNPLEEFLAGISLQSDLDNLDPEGEAVVLMTLHSAKGLEFPVVFLVGMDEGVFPHSRAQVDLVELEEERRLCYVGITRAQDKLYLTNAWRRTLYGKSQYNPPSRFLDEIPPELLTKKDPIDGGDTASKGSMGSSIGSGSMRSGSISDSKAISQSGGNADKSYILGDKVEHSKFGLGTIVGIKGEGGSAELTIAFPQAGLKKLIAEYAPLKKVN